MKNILIVMQTVKKKVENYYKFCQIIVNTVCVYIFNLNFNIYNDHTNTINNLLNQYSKRK